MVRVIRNNVIPRQSPETFGSPDPPPAHSVLFERSREKFFRGNGGRVVQLAIVFLENNLDLALQLVRIKARMQQRVRLDCERLLYVLGWNNGVVHGSVVVGVRV